MNRKGVVTIMQRWATVLLERDQTLRVIGANAHEHYDAESDRRWVCRDHPCLKHHAAPCPDRAHPGE